MDSDAPIEIPEGKYSLQFDGVGDYVDLDNPAALQITGSLTIEMWVKPARFPVREGGLYCKAFPGEGYALIKGDGRLRYGYGQNPSDLFGSSGSYQFIDSTKSLQVKQWSHVAIVRNLEAPERKLSWYINGVLDSEVGAQFATARAGNLPVQIGRQSGRSFYFPGQIDEVRVWSRARSADEIKADMHHQLEGNEPGLVGYWRFDEGEGSIVHDRTANANHGTIYGAKWAPSAPVEKRPTYLEAESALQFASDDTYVDCGAGIDLRGTDFTVELWAKRTAPDGGQQFAIGHGNSNERQHVLHIGFRANNQFTFAFGDDDAVSTQRRFRDTNWHHWACVYTHAARRRVMYCDGEQLNPKNNTAKAPYQGTGQFVIGKAPWGDGWRGDIDEVRVWRCARSPDDIQHDRSHRLVGDEPDLVAYWRFDEGAGNTTRNQTANAHHGTLHGNTNNAMWVTSSAPVRDHPSLDRSSFAFAGRTIASGLSALLYAPQRGSQIDATPDIARVLLAVATGGANTAEQPTDPQSIALVDFAVSPYGKLGQGPDILALPAVTANAAVLSDLQRNAQREAELQGSIIQGFVPQDPPLAASNTQRHAYFGSAVAISGDWAIVGAHEASPDGVAHAGSAEVFRLKDDKWVYHQTLMASDKQANAHFGVAVAISGQWALVGAYEASLPGFDYAGNVEVFRLKDDKWVYDKPLMASDKQANAHFGVAVALDEKWAIVGADTANAGGVAGAGKAYLFELVNDTWADPGRDRGQR